MSAVGDAPTPADLLRLVAQRRRLALVVGVLVAVVVAGVGLSGPALYRAEARIAIERGRLEVPFASNPSFDGEDLVLVYTQRDLLLSNAVLRHGLDSGVLNSNPAYGGTGDPLAVLRRRLAVVVNRDSRVLVVQLSDEDPQRAERALGLVLGAFLAEQSRRDQARAERSVEFLGRQVEEARLALEKARHEEQEFRVAHRLFTDEAERSFETQRLTTLQGKLVVMREQVSSLDTLLARLDEAARADDPRGLVAAEAVARNPVVFEVQKQLLELENRRDALAERYLDQHPRMLESQRQVASKRAQLRESAMQVVRGLKAEREKLAGQLANLETHITNEQAALDLYKRSLMELQGYIERTHSRSQLYEQLLKRLGEESVASRLDRSEAVLADPPRATMQPVSWSALLVLPMSVVVGGLAALAAALAAAALDQRLRGPQALARASGLSVLASLPDLDNAPPPTDTADPALEPARRLRAALALRRPAGTSTAWVLIGASVGCGTSASAAQLAVAFAAAGARTLLVDADLRAPSLALRLGSGQGPDLAALLAGEPAVSPWSTPWANLDLMAARNPSDQASELLHSHCWTEWIAAMRGHYDQIIIDAPALDAVADAVVVAGAADAVLLVGAEATPRDAVESALAVLEPLRSRFVGAIHTIPREAAP